MAHEDFVTYEQAVNLNILGFDWKCNHYYNYKHNLVEYIISHESSYYNWNDKICKDFRDVSAPTLAQAQKWLRYNGIDVLVIKETRFSAFYKVICLTNNFKTWTIKQQPSNFNDYSYNTYEEALSAGIDKALNFF